MMEFAGEQELAQPPANIWPKLSDARFLVQAVPDVESIAQSQADRAVCVLRPGLAFVRGTLELTVQVVGAEPEKSVRLALHTKGIGSSSDVEATVLLTPEEHGGTHVHWTAVVKNLGGLLRAVPQGLIKAAAQKVIGDVWTALEAQLAR